MEKGAQVGVLGEQKEAQYGRIETLAVAKDVLGELRNFLYGAKPLTEEQAAELPGKLHLE